MNEQTPLPASDPISTILVAVTEMRGELRSALSEVKRHDGEIVKNTERISSLENRMTAVETTAGRDDSHQQHAVSSRAAFFTMIGACVAVLTLLAAILFQVRGG